MIQEIKALFAGTFKPCKKVDDVVACGDIIGHIFQAFERAVEADNAGKILWLEKPGTILRKGAVICRIEEEETPPVLVVVAVESGSV